MGSASCNEDRVRDRYRLIGFYKPVLKAGDTSNRQIQPIRRNLPRRYRLFHGLEGGDLTITILTNQQDIASCQHRTRSEEHTSELQSQSNLVCRLLLEKKKKKKKNI